MMIPSVNCTITKMESGHDIYGAVKRLSTSRSTKCGVVKLMNERRKSTVRVDSSASRGHADEILADARLLFRKNDGEFIDAGDKIEISRLTLKVESVRERYTVYGAFDHFEVDANVWASK